MKSSTIRLVLAALILCLASACSTVVEQPIAEEAESKNVGRTIVYLELGADSADKAAARVPKDAEILAIRIHTKDRHIDQSGEWYSCSEDGFCSGTPNAGLEYPPRVIVDPDEPEVHQLVIFAGSNRPTPNKRTFRFEVLYEL